MDFGTAVHASCERYLRTRVIDVALCESKLVELWKLNAKDNVDGYAEQPIEEWLVQARDILAEVPKFLDDTFPNWEYVDAEHFLYEPIPSQEQAFKGYIDAVISVKTRGKHVTWLLDWKTCGFGWNRYKRSDDLVLSQLKLYKTFWCTKMSVELASTRCGFVLLKRTAPSGSRCELVPVSVGEKTSKRTLKVVNNMLSSVKRGIALKNRDACKWCDYRETKHCP